MKTNVFDRLSIRLTFISLGRIVLLCFLFGGERAGAATKSSANGNWGDPANWTPYGIPGAGDDVNLVSYVTNTVNTATAVCAKLFSYSPSGLKFSSSSSSLTVYTQFSANGMTLNMSSGGSLSFGGTVSLTGPSSLIAGTGTVYYNGGDQTVFSAAYYNLELSGYGTKSVSAGTTSANLSIAYGVYANIPAAGITVTTLKLWGAGRINGTWGSPQSAATYKVDYFTGTGVVTVQTDTRSTPTLTWPTAATLTYGQTLSASLLSGGSSTPAGSFGWVSPATVPPAGQTSQSVRWTPSDYTYSSAQQSVTVRVNKASPTVYSWPAASALSFGQSLAASTLSGGSASVAGTFAWTNSATLPPRGTNTYGVTFTPNDTNNYNTAAGSVSVIVNKANPSVNAWPAASAIRYGQSLASSTLSGGSASVAGAFAWTAPSTVPGAGTNQQSVTFTPTNTTNYNTLVGSVSVTVNKADPGVVWAAPEPITLGTRLGVAQLNPTAAVPGVFAFVPPAGTMLPAGANPLKAVFSPTDAANYATVTNSVTLVVNEPSQVPAPVFVGIAPCSQLIFSNLTAGSLYRLQRSERWYWKNQPVSFLAEAAFHTQLIAGVTGDCNYRAALEPAPSQAFARAEVLNGQVVGVTLSNGGSGYAAAPAVTFTGGNGSGATGFSQVSDGAVTNIVITDAGTGYTLAPTVRVGQPPATAVTARAQPIMRLDVASLLPYHSYRIQFATDLTGVWLDPPDGLFSLADIVRTQWLSVTNAAGFFRVRLVQ